MKDQLNFWTGQFGEEYMNRNVSTSETNSKLIKAWSQILKILPDNELTSILEVGCNIGLNLRALKLITKAALYGVEPFQKALDQCVEDNIILAQNSFLSSIFNLNMFTDNQIDLVFTSGVLIHIHPSSLRQATDNIVRVAKKYVVCIEYFSDKEEEVVYRGYKNLLFKRDFGAFYLDNCPQLKLKDYGFFWKRATDLDNSTWWLFEKV